MFEHETAPNPTEQARASAMRGIEHLRTDPYIHEYTARAAEFYVNAFFDGIDVTTMTDDDVAARVLHINVVTWDEIASWGQLPEKVLTDTQIRSVSVAVAASHAKVAILEQRLARRSKPMETSGIATQSERPAVTAVNLIKDAFQRFSRHR